MLNKTTTSTGLLLLGLTTSFANSFISASLRDYEVFDEKIGAESFYSTQTNEKFRVEKYVESVYKIDSSNSFNYSNIDAGFFHIFQNFAESQIELEKEFYSLMDDLLISKINNSPTKKRF